MNKFQPHIIPVYPPSNHLIFEEWFAENYKGCDTDRELLPIFPTSFHVNNGYGASKQELQDYCDTLSTDKKYLIICQYDDGCLVDWKGKDVLEFNMSKQVGVQIPLICQPYSIRYDKPKKYIASFIGSITHPIRSKVIDALRGKDGYYISTEPHDYDRYNQIISESIFCLSPRGYGAASFRCYCEAVYQNSIPVYISDTHIIPFNIDFNEFGILVHENNIEILDDILLSIQPEEIIEKQNNLPIYYDKYFSYIGCMNNIIKHLESEYHGSIGG